MPPLDKKKFLVPAELNVGQFVYVIRKRLRLSPEKAIFLFMENMLPPTGASMSQMYKDHADSDGFLYAMAAGDHVYGDDFR